MLVTMGTWMSKDHFRAPGPEIKVHCIFEPSIKDFKYYYNKYNNICNVFVFVYICNEMPRTPIPILDQYA